MLAPITADILSARGTVNGTNRAGEQPMGDVIADRMYEATRPRTSRGCAGGGVNVGGVRSKPLSARSAAASSRARSRTRRPSPCNRSATRWSSRPDRQQLYDVLGSGSRMRRGRTARDGGLAGDLLVEPHRSTSGEARPGRFAEDQQRHRRRGGGGRIIMNNFIADDDEQVHRLQSSPRPLGGDVDVDAFERG